VCGDCREYAEGNLHPYIPLLAVNPTIKSKGYGTSIVRDLIDGSAILASLNLCHDVLFLDVYTTNQKAIDVYTECGFRTISPAPIPDPQEEGKTYVVMAKRVSIG
jgi:ribosomal protein S18 acetylase RimI-like enzyme